MEHRFDFCIQFETLADLYYNPADPLDLPKYPPRRSLMPTTVDAELLCMRNTKAPVVGECERSAGTGHQRRFDAVAWGEFNMVEAERRLLANALLDFSNQRFVLLSESCIPLFNFSTMYTYLNNSTQNFVHVMDLPGPAGRGRFNPLMRPNITIEQWRKGAQWFEMDRDLALEVISDRKYFPIFQKFRKRYADEHYLPTFVNTKVGERNSNRTLTWVDWSKRGSHPAKLNEYDVTVKLLERLRSGKECEYNGKITNVCFLFARKFTPHSLDRLLRLAPKVMQFSGKA